MDAPLNETAFTEPAGIALCKTTDTASASNGKSRLSLSKRKQKAKTNPPSSDPTDNDASTDTALTFSSSSSSSQKQVSANKQPVTPTADTRSETDNKKLPEEAPSLQSKSSAENGVEIPLCDAENSDHDKADGFGRNNAIPCGNPQNHLQESAVEESLAGTCSEAQEPLNASFELAFTNISVTSCDEGTKEDEAPPSSEPSPPRETSPLSEEDDESTTLKMEKEAAKENNMTNKTKCPLAMSQEPSAAGEKRPTSVPNSVASVEEIHASLSTRGSSQPLGNVPSKLLQDHFTNSQPLLPMINDDDDIVIESRLTKAKRTKVNKLSLSRTKKRKIN
ncbi:uncharacterized protein BYT42DRAFT_222642 [Radiomyces spectabilis]|uniref:uncharacterized protein n=1 Tax=Radiomyces spectabilis TaxID=64574 RepID=UPI00221F1EA2|nr:uncharacterized protein BYT42DRAFT_222642 [Radiomyces spectabilis]KAI8388110.1 hypothetical protein BYT42DRAFT_222642 [Radiomyces spectabilis]